MQQWLEGGYFNDDLLIKRTTIDSDFEPLRDVRRRAPPLRPGEVHIQMFLSPLAPRAPPNLPPPQASLLESHTPPNPSPRLAHLMTGTLNSTHGPMSAGVNGSPLANSPALSATRSTTLDSYLTPSLDQSNYNGAPGSVPGEGPVAAVATALTNAALERKKREDFIQSLRERELAQGVGSPNPPSVGMSGPFGASFIPNPSVHHPQYSTFPSNSPALSPFNNRLNMTIPPTPIHAPVSNAALGVISPFPHNGPVLWSSGEQLNTPASYNASPGSFDHGAIYQSVPGQQQQVGTWLDNFAPQEARWDVAEQHDLPPAVEAALNVTEEPLRTPITDSGVHDSPSSVQRSLPGESDTKAIENVTAALEQATIEAEPVAPSEAMPEPVVAEPTPLPAAAPAEVTPASSNKRKNTNASSKGKAVPAMVAIPKEPVVSSTPSPASPPAPSKAWATPDDDKPSSMSLREIQEAEARRAEARKAAEKVAKAVPPPSTASDESAPVTGSWGLPQVGTRSTAPVSTPSSNGTPAWVKPAAAPAGKKSMKEIQEEEEKRKKAAAAKEAQAIAAAQQASKRAYAESAKVSHEPQSGYPEPFLNSI